MMMDDDLKQAIIRIAASLDRTSDSIEKAPANMARNNSRERTHEANTSQHQAGKVAGQAIGAVGSESGTMSLLRSIPIAGAAAAAAGSQFLGSNAWQQQHKMPYEKASDYAKAAGEAGVTMSESQSQYVRDYYRRRGEIITHNLNLVDRQNSVLGNDFEEKRQALSQGGTDLIHGDPNMRAAYAEHWADGLPSGQQVGNALSWNPLLTKSFWQNQYLHWAEMEGK